MVKVQYGDWLIGYCLAPSEHYFSFIQDYVEMREGLGLPGKQFLTVTDKVWRVGQGRKIESFVVATNTLPTMASLSVL